MHTKPSESVQIANSELQHIKSSFNEQDYLIKIRLPEKYAESDKVYPVLYLLDGDHAFAMATDIVQYLIYGEQVPDLVIVSPAYGSKSSLAEGGGNRRNRDLIPFIWENFGESAGASEFLQFFKQELIPFVEANYRVDRTKRTFSGGSFGAIFAFYVLFQAPELFHNYIIIEGIDNQFYEIERQYAQNHSELPARVWTAATPSDWGKEMFKFVETLKSKDYRGLQIDFEWLSDIGHFAIPAEGLTKGLVSIFRK